MANTNLGTARKAKNDEFYTQYADIEKEMNAYIEYDPDVFKGKTVLLPCDDPESSNFTKYFAQNFGKFGLRKLVSTSYAPNSKPREIPYQPTLFEIESPDFDESKTQSNGKIFTLTRDTTGDKIIDFEDLEWSYLDGDGDFRSEEVTRLRDEADFIITNPPFSLFREFLAWVFEAEKKCSMIGNTNAITYKEVFPLIKSNKLWLGSTANNTDLVFEVPEGQPIKKAYQDKAARMGYVGNYTRLGNACWFTNIEHGRRHQPLPLMSEKDNIKFSRHKDVNGVGYRRYANFDGIEVPFTDAIPSDFDGMMGVPISFLDKYSPEQFEILGSSGEMGTPMSEIAEKGTYQQGGPSFYCRNPDGTFERLYKRIVIRHRKPQ